MSYLAEHLVVDILVRLPANSVIRFGCVCKSWYSLFRNPNFMLSHSAFWKNNQPLQLLVHRLGLNYCDTISLLSDSGNCLQSQPLYESLGLTRSSFSVLRVVGSCNGVLCFVHSAFNRYFVLFNPSIKHCLWLPSPKSHLEYHRYIHSVGFGFDIATMDFKILIFRFQDTASAEVYSLNSNSWRGISVPKFSFVFNRYGVFVNGALHWVVRMNQKNLVIVFDVKDETFRQIALPCCYVNCDEHRRFDVIEYGGSSIAVTQQHDSTVYESDVWVMKEYGVTESWTHLATIGKHMRGHSQVLMIGDQDQVFIKFDFMHLASLKLNQTAAKVLMAVGEYESLSPHRYVPSLFLLDKENNSQVRIEHVIPY